MVVTIIDNSVIV